MKLSVSTEKGGSALNGVFMFTAKMWKRPFKNVQKFQIRINDFSASESGSGFYI
jgi:hypothetical protein